MKRTILIFVILGIIKITTAQETEISKKLGIGFQINQYQKDFGLGLNLTSPYFANNKIAFRLRGNLMFNEYVKNAETIWEPYSNLCFGMVGSNKIINNFLRLYGEGGLITLFPTNNISSDNYVLGGYGLFGFEFYFENNTNYFIEIGGVGTGAIADKQVNKPIYSNGLLINCGFRIQVK